MTQTTKYAIKTECSLPFDAAVNKAREELAKEGFGVLTEIDVKATLKKKIDVDFRPYIILGACNPPLAHEALSSDLDIGLLLPCNLVVYGTDDPNVSAVAAIDPSVQLGIVEVEGIQEVAAQVRRKLENVIAAMT